MSTGKKAKLISTLLVSLNRFYEHLYCCNINCYIIYY